MTFHKRQHNQDLFLIDVMYYKNVQLFLESSHQTLCNIVIQLKGA